MNISKLRREQHRDLHENNICVSVRKHGMPDRDMLPQSVKFGRSYIEVTLIDYGLSRAKLLSGEVVFNDLETDLVIFQQKDGQRQFDTYRRYVSTFKSDAHTNVSL
jgi:serine/threonine-protein kinase haspin